MLQVTNYVAVTMLQVTNYVAGNYVPGLALSTEPQMTRTIPQLRELWFTDLKAPTSLED